MTYTVRKHVREDRRSNRTGSPTVRKTVWMIVRKSDGRVIDTARSKAEAERRARVMR